MDQSVGFHTITEFENRIAEFFGAPYAVAVDSCTSGLELCLRYTKAEKMYSPTRTYLSVPMLAHKLGIELEWVNATWESAYMITDDICDAATLWKHDSYRADTFMCISMQFQKHLSLGRVGVILTDNAVAAETLRRLSYDGRIPGVPWRDQNVSMFGFHYYCQPELAQKGLDKLQAAIDSVPRIWSDEDYPDVSKMDVFKNSL